MTAIILAACTAAGIAVYRAAVRPALRALRLI